MNLKTKKMMAVALLAALIGGSAYALTPKKPEVRENLTTWTRTSPTENEWVEGNGSSAQCLSASLICQYQFPIGYDPNDHEYDDNMIAGAPEPGVGNGYKPL